MLLLLYYHYYTYNYIIIFYPGESKNQYSKSNIKEV